MLSAVTDAYSSLREELRFCGADLASTVCVDEWTVKDLLAVRVWWTEQVVAWIEAGRRGESPELSAPGYRWRETSTPQRRLCTRLRRRNTRRFSDGWTRVLSVSSKPSVRSMTTNCWRRGCLSGRSRVPVFCHIAPPPLGPGLWPPRELAGTHATRRSPALRLDVVWPTRLARPSMPARKGDGFFLWSQG